MTKAEIEQQYVVRNGIIASPGKFEGEMVYAPHFWDIYLNGGGDYAGDDVLACAVIDEDRAEFQELVGVSVVKMWEDDNGFVYVEAA